MIARLIIGFALSTAAIASQAQGTIAPTGNIPTAESAPPPDASNSNPFKPPQPAPDLPVAAVEIVAAPEIDPAVAALEASLREMRERGERIGTVDGKVIYKHQGRYLIEAPTPGKDSTVPSAEQSSSLSEECVIRVTPAYVSSSAPASAASTSNR